MKFRIPRPLRDLLRSSRDGLQHAARRAWDAAGVAPGEWVRVNPAGLLDGCGKGPVMALRMADDRLDLRLAYAGGVHATAVARRVIVVAPALPETIVTAAHGRPLRDLIDAPFLRDPAITIQRIIHRDGDPSLDIRCRCPSHLLRRHRDS